MRNGNHRNHATPGNNTHNRHSNQPRARESGPQRKVATIDLDDSDEEVKVEVVNRTLSKSSRDSSYNSTWLVIQAVVGRRKCPSKRGAVGCAR